MEYSGTVAAVGERVRRVVGRRPRDGHRGRGRVRRADHDARAAGAPGARRCRPRRRRGDPRGVPHRMGCARPPGRPDERTVGAGPRRRVRRRHGGDPDRARRSAPGSRSRARPARSTCADRSARTSRSSARRTTGWPTCATAVPGGVRHGARRDRRRRGGAQPRRGQAAGHDRPGRSDGRRRRPRSTSGCCSPSGCTGSARRCAARPLEQKAAVCRRFADEVLPLFADGTLRPVIDSRFTLDADRRRTPPHGGERERRQDRRDRARLIRLRPVTCAGTRRRTRVGRSDVRCVPGAPRLGNPNQLRPEPTAPRTGCARNRLRPEPTAPGTGCARNQLRSERGAPGGGGERSAARGCRAGAAPPPSRLVGPHERSADWGLRSATGEGSGRARCDAVGDDRGRGG